MIIVSGSIFDSECEVLVNPVNTRGVMGKGLALALAKMYPEMLEEYKQLHANGHLRIGKVYVCQVHDGRTIAMLPTKDDWRAPSKIEYVQKGMDDLALCVKYIDAKSVAIPALGCGLGGLDFKQVEAVVKSVCDRELPNVHIEMYTGV